MSLLVIETFQKNEKITKEIYLQPLRISSSELVQVRFNCGKYKLKSKRYGDLDGKWRLSVTEKFTNKHKYK